MASDAPTATSIFSLIPNLQNEGNYSSVMANPELRTILSTLEGLQMYLYSGAPCSFENLQDLMDMMEAYTLYRSVLTSPRADLRQAFSEGRVGCILRRAIHEESGGHDHEVNGSVVHHQVSRHDLLVTPATIQLEGLPADTPVSDCLVVR
ncbi:MAG: hypothetical protein K8R69_11565 [Deltaproteobacteria bacterium]|nr:hypothetical protein [Deltaproteobacteria bacterium]